MGLLDLFKNTNTIQFDASKNSTQDVTNGVVNSSNNSAGVSVTEDTAMSVACLNQGINIIAETIASMPIYLYKDIDGFATAIPDDPRSMALSGVTANVLTSYNLKRSLIKDMILYGNAYAQIIKTGNSYDFVYLPPSLITPHMDASGYFFNVQTYTTSVLGETVPAQVVANEDMLVLIRNPQYNSIVGKGLLEEAKSTLQMSMEEENYMINLFKNGLSAKAILTSKTPFKKEVKQALKRDLMNLYSGSNNSGKTLVVEGDIDVKNLALTPIDINLIENQKFTVAEIARFLNIPKYMLNIDRGQGTYSNITMERMQLLTNTLTPYVTAIEQALNQKLLSPQEQQQGCYFKCNTQEMLKMSPQDNSQYMLNLYNANVVTLEEVRASLNLGGNEDTIQQLKQFQILKMQQSVNQVVEQAPADGEQAKEEASVEKSAGIKPLTSTDGVDDNGTSKQD